MKKDIFLLSFLGILCITEAVCAAPGYYDQLDLIADQAEIWKQEDAFGLWGYTVTDLDRNGRLEIISASVQGTGFYTTIKIFEVIEDGNALSEVLQDRSEGDSAPDVIMEKAPAYYNPGAGTYLYIFDDITRNGFAEYYENKRAVYLENGVWKEIPLGLKTTIYSDQGHAAVIFADSAGHAISEAQYNAIAADTFGAFESSEVCFAWNMTDTDSFQAQSRETLLESLKAVVSPVCPDEIPAQ